MRHGPLVVRRAMPVGPKSGAPLVLCRRAARGAATEGLGQLPRWRADGQLAVPAGVLRRQPAGATPGATLPGITSGRPAPDPCGRLGRTPAVGGAAGVSQLVGPPVSRRRTLDPGTKPWGRWCFCARGA
jgi:hypothetical protein